MSGVRSSWLMLARNCDLCWLALRELPTLVLDFVEQAHVLDCDGRLVGESRYQLDLLLGEGPDLGPEWLPGRKNRAQGYYTKNHNEMMPASKRSIAIINIASCVALLAPSWVVAIGHLHEHRFARRRPALMRRHFGSVSEREPGQRAGIGRHLYRPLSGLQRECAPDI